MRSNVPKHPVAIADRYADGQYVVPKLTHYKWYNALKFIESINTDLLYYASCPLVGIYFILYTDK